MTSSENTLGEPENLLHTYQALSDAFEQLYTQAKHAPVTDELKRPSWVKPLMTLAKSPEANTPVGDFLLKNHPERALYLREQFAKYVLGLETSKGAKNSLGELEARVMGMSPQGTAVFIGSGSQPNSVLGYARYAGNVVGLDIDPQAIEHAQKQYSQPNIAYRLEDGETFNYQGASQIGIAIMVPHKERILRRISETANPGCMVSVRTTSGLKSLLYTPFVEQVPSNLIKVATLHPPDQINHAVIYQKMN